MNDKARVCWDILFVKIYKNNWVFRKEKQMEMKKQKHVIVLIVALSLVIPMLNGVDTSAKGMQDYHCSKVIVADGTKYKISQIAKDVHDIDTGEKMTQKLKNKKIKWVSKNKNLKIVGKTFTAKKIGKYKLIGITKKKRYTIDLDVVSKTPKKDLSMVEYATIQSGSDGTVVKIEEQEAIRNLCALINEAKFKFNYKRANKGPMVGWNYAVHLYLSDGTEQFKIVDSTPKYYYTTSRANEINRYVDQLFKMSANVTG